MVLAINADEVAVRSAFRANESLNFSLLSDTKKDTLRAYGVLDDSGSVKRVTYLVAPDGTVRGIDDAVDAEIQGIGSERVSSHGANLSLLFSDWRARVGEHIPPFFLPDAERRSRSWLRKGAKATVLLVLDGSDALRAQYRERVNRIARSNQMQDVSFLGIARSGAETGKTAEVFPIVSDPYGDVLPRLESQGNSIVIVLDGHGKVVYKGLDLGNYNGRYTSFVVEILNALRAGRPIPKFER